MSRKFRIEVKEHKVSFVLDLLENMPFVTVTPLDEGKDEKPPIKD
tara:strand:- start:50 stop:184 length:135 start_codon:yes stop_codon:yes gene_type:complete